MPASTSPKLHPGQHLSHVVLAADHVVEDMLLEVGAIGGSAESLSSTWQCSCQRARWVGKRDFHIRGVPGP